MDGNRSLLYISSFTPQFALKPRFYSTVPSNPRVFASKSVLNSQRPHSLCMQVSSDSRTYDEYMDFLQNKVEHEELHDQPSIIIGAGRIGTFLASLGNEQDLVLKRGDSIPKDHPGPIYICTRNSDLASIIESCPDEKRKDLIFLQNGMLDPLLRRYDLTSNTMVNVYFAVPKIGAKPKDGITDLNPEGLTCTTGRWGVAVQERLEKAELSCKVLHERDFRRSMFEKLIWICSVMLVGAVHGNITVGQVEKKHSSEVADLVQEMAMMARSTARVALAGGTLDRVLAYCRSVPDFPTALKEFEWRNGYFYEFSLLARKKGIDDPMPIHTDYLEDGKKRGLIDW
mmetsp:Transcript_6050/g.10752  ORF Transcript_6050/g.10752 Transcript_6050/m.10752 type:complete len:342 (-) Transcript_6050:1650-2675(-)